MESDIDYEFSELAGNPSTATHKLVANGLASVTQAISWRWHMSHQVATAEAAGRYFALLPAEERGFAELGHLYQAGVSPYYMMVAFTSTATHGAERCPVRRQVIPRADELDDPSGEADPLVEAGQSPVPEVVHMYPDRVAFCVAQLCPVYCRYCFRKRRDDESGLHFNRTILSRGLEYIRSNTAIRDVLVTGGDPFIASDDALRDLTGALYYPKAYCDVAGVSADLDQYPF
jgi:lysine 2,3-aminomutase